MAQARIHA